MKANLRFLTEICAPVKGVWLIIIATGLLVFGPACAAQDSQSPVMVGNPYATIVARNTFGLVSPLPPDPRVETVWSGPQITPNGIMTVFGRRQALFTVVTDDDRPGRTAKGKTYLLAEGQAEDEIEVTHIDEKAALVTFNNHGTIEVIPLLRPVYNPLAAASRSEH